MSDRSGEVVAVGAGVSNWQPGDRVMSLFFPDWLYGKPTPPAPGRLVAIQWMAMHRNTPVLMPRH